MYPSLRLRLAIWYAALLAIILASTSIISYGYHSTAHYEDMDRSLVFTSIHVAGEIKGKSAAEIKANPQLPPVDEFAAPDIFVRVYDSDGNQIAASPNTGHLPQVHPEVAASGKTSPEMDIISTLMRPIVNVGRPHVVAEGGFVTTWDSLSQSRFRFYAAPIGGAGTVGGYIESGVSLDQLDRSMERLRLLLTIMSVVGLLAAVLGGWAIAARALLPVAVIASTARAIALSRGFSRRLPDIGRRDELGQLAQTFNEMLESLDEAYTTQQRFVADASHELRTPLTTLKGNLELFDRAADLPDEERAAILTQLRHEADRMSGLVSDLLLLARADAGQNVRTIRVELDRLLMDVFGSARLMARGQKLSIVDLDELEVEGDPDRLKQLLLILLDNALKYTPQGGEVHLGMRKEQGAAVVTISDSGIGIAPEDLPHIFERFYRADKARSRESGGTGLGLSIASWIAERHGGSISVESTPGKGSVFTFRLPLPPARGKL